MPKDKQVSDRCNVDRKQLCCSDVIVDLSQQENRCYDEAEDQTQARLQLCGRRPSPKNNRFLGERRQTGPATSSQLAQEHTISLSLLIYFLSAPSMLEEEEEEEEEEGHSLTHQKDT